MAISDAVITFVERTHAPWWQSKCFVYAPPCPGELNETKRISCWHLLELSQRFAIAAAFVVDIVVVVAAVDEQ